MAFLTTYQVAFHLSYETLTFSGTGSGVASHYGCIGPSGVPSARGPWAYGEWDAGCEWGSVKVVVGEGSTNPSPPACTGSVAYGLNITVNANGVTQNTWVDACSPASINLDYSGTFSFSLDVERILVVTYQAPGNDNSVPFYDTVFGAIPVVPSGSSPIDMPTATDWAIFDIPKLGGTASSTVTAGGLTATSSATITSGMVSSIGRLQYIATLEAIGNATISWTGATTPPASQASTVSVTGQYFGGGTSVAVTAPFSATSPSGDSSVDASGGASATATFYFSTGTDTQAVLSVGYTPTRQAHITGGIWQMETHSTHPVTVSINGRTAYTNISATSSFSDTVSQARYNAEAWFNGDTSHTTTVIVNEQATVFAFIQPAGITPSGGNPASAPSRLLFRGMPPFSVGTIKQLANITIDTPAASNYTAGAHTTLTGTAPMSIAVAGGDGGFTRSWGAGLGPNLSGYAWLRFQFAVADAGATITVAIKSWSWTTVIASDGTVDIDTTDLWMSGSGISLADSRWPLSTGDQQGYGITTMDTVTISELPAGHTYLLSSITMLRKDHSKLTILPSWNYAIARGDGTLNNIARLAVGDTDGRQSVELASALEVINPPSPAIWGPFTINDVLADLATVPGYTVTPQSNISLCWGWVYNSSFDQYQTSPVPPPFFSIASCFSNNAFGLGSWLTGYQRSGGAWVSTFDLDTSSTLTLNAQAQFDTLSSWPPGCGDVLGVGGGGSGPIELPCYAILDAEGWGLVFTGSGARDGGIGITIKDDITGLPQGSATTDSSGQYLTGSPYVPGWNISGGGPGTTDVTAGYATPLTASDVFFPIRYRRRVAFGPVVGFKYMTSLRDYSGTLVDFTVSNIGNLVCLLFDVTDLVYTEVIVDGGSQCSVFANGYFLDIDTIEGVHLSGSAGTTAVHGRSTDHGRTWTLENIPSANPYTAITSCHQLSRFVLMGWHQNAGGGDTVTTGWYLHTGTLNQDGTYAWNGPFAVTLPATPTIYGHLKSRDDGVLEFCFLDSSNNPHISYNYGLPIGSATGWV